MPCNYFKATPLTQLNYAPTRNNMSKIEELTTWLDKECLRFEKINGENTVARLDELIKLKDLCKTENIHQIHAYLIERINELSKHVIRKNVIRKYQSNRNVLSTLQR